MTDMHIDQKVLSDLREVMEDGYLQLVQTFLEDSERRLSQLHGARSAEELGSAAHSFKGSSSNMGAFAWANNATSASYTPSESYSYTSGAFACSGGTNSADWRSRS